LPPRSNAAALTAEEPVDAVEAKTVVPVVASPARSAAPMPAIRSPTFISFPAFSSLFRVPFCVSVLNCSVL
jgi:hypothetical protein